MSLLRRRTMEESKLPRPTITVYEKPAWYNYYHTKIGYDRDVSILSSDGSSNGGGDSVIYLLNPNPSAVKTNESNQLYAANVADFIHFFISITPYEYHYTPIIQNFNCTEVDIFAYYTENAPAYGFSDYDHVITEDGIPYKDGYTLGDEVYNGLLIYSGRQNSDGWYPDVSTGHPGISQYIHSNAGFRISVVGFDSSADPDNYVYVDINLLWMPYYVAIEEIRHYYTYDSSFNRATYDASNGYTIDASLAKTITDPNGLYKDRPPIYGAWNEGMDSDSQEIPDYLITNIGSNSYRFVDRAPIMTRRVNFKEQNPLVIGLDDLGEYKPYMISWDATYFMDMNSCIAMKLRTNMLGIFLTATRTTNNIKYLSYVSIGFGASNRFDYSTSNRSYFIETENDYERSIWLVLKNHRNGTAGDAGNALNFNIGGYLPLYNSQTSFAQTYDVSIRLKPYPVLKFEHTWSIPVSNIQPYHTASLIFYGIEYCNQSSNFTSGSSTYYFMQACGDPRDMWTPEGVYEPWTKEEHIGATRYEGGSHYSIYLRDDYQGGASIYNENVMTYRTSCLYNAWGTSNPRSYFGNILWFRFKCHGTNTSTARYLRYQLVGSTYGSASTINASVTGKNWAGTADANIFTRTTTGYGSEQVYYTTKKGIGVSSSANAINGYNPQCWVIKYHMDFS